MKGKFSQLEVLTNALECAQNGTLILPKTYENLSQEDGKLIESYGITKIGFEKGSNLKFIDVLAFFENQTLEEIDFSNCEKLNKISKKSFLHANKLKNIIFAENNNLKEIGERAFIGTSVKEVHLNNSALETIGDYAFYDAKRLEVLDMSKCKNLKYVGTAITLGDLRLKLWDMSCCDKIEKFLGNGTHAEVLRVNANLRANGDADFYQTMVIGRVEIWDGGEMKDKFLVLDSMGDDSIARLNVLKTGYLKDLNRLGFQDFSVQLINRFESQSEFKTFLKNKAKFDEIVEKTNPAKNFSAGVWVMLKILGYTGFENANKKDLLEYKRLLARDMLYYKKFSAELSQREKLAQMSEEEKAVFDNEINILAQKIAKKSREYPLGKLIEIFLKNNVYKNQSKEKLAYEFQCFEKSEPKLDFAKFLVSNFNEIMERKISLNDISAKRNIEFNEYQTLAEIYKNFDKYLTESNKMPVTRLVNQRFELKDCEGSMLTDCKSGNEELRDLCERVGMRQNGFELLQELFEKGKKIARHQILKCAEDCQKTGIHYEMIYKDNPLGLVLGNITNCCQRYDEEMINDVRATGWDCVVLGEVNPYSCFVAFKKDDKIIGQSWLWYNEENKTIGIDNIEIPVNLKKIVNQTHAEEFISCLNRLGKRLFEDMNASGFPTKNVIIGCHATDVSRLDKSYPKEKDEEKCLGHNFVRKDGISAYTDAISKGQYFVYKDGKFMFKEIENILEK